MLKQVQHDGLLFPRIYFRVFSFIWFCFDLRAYALPKIRCLEFSLCSESFAFEPLVHFRSISSLSGLTLFIRVVRTKIRCLGLFGSTQKRGFSSTYGLTPYRKSTTKRSKELHRLNFLCVLFCLSINLCLLTRLLFLIHRILVVGF